MSLEAKNHLTGDNGDPHADLTKKQAKETAKHEAEEKYGVESGKYNLRDVSAPSHTNADGQIEVDMPNTDATPQIEYHD